MVSGSYSVKNHRREGSGEWARPSPGKKCDSNYNILFLASGTENSDGDADADRDTKNLIVIITTYF